jgi:hypothetical protein
LGEKRFFFPSGWLYPGGFGFYPEGFGFAKPTEGKKKKILCSRAILLLKTFKISTSLFIKRQQQVLKENEKDY